MREFFYTESNEAGIFIQLSVNTKLSVYNIEYDLSEDDIDMGMVDFLAPAIFEALIEGLKAKGYKEE